MTFREEILKLLLDKGLLAGIAFVLWHFYSRSQKRTEAKERKAEKLENEVRQLKKEKQRTERAEAMGMLERQINEFYWPMQYCLQVDFALWDRVPRLSRKAQLPAEIGDRLERDALLPNHAKALNVIDRSFGLVASDVKLRDAILRYVRHATVYRAMRAAADNLNPIEYGEPFPKDLPELIDKALAETRRRLEALRHERWQDLTEQSGIMNDGPIESGSGAGARLSAT